VFIHLFDAWVTGAAESIMMLGMNEEQVGLELAERSDVAETPFVSGGRTPQNNPGFFQWPGPPRFSIFEILDHHSCLPRNGLVVIVVRSSLLSLALCVGLACAGGQAPGSNAGPEGGPVITKLSPSSGQAGEAYPIEVTIEGRGFAETGNVVIFGGIPSDGLSSSENGTCITFWVPKQAPSPGEAPPMVLTPGEYPVTVKTPHGTSEPVMFTLTPGEE
jgi:hypothetical protein